MSKKITPTLLLAICLGVPGVATARMQERPPQERPPQGTGESREQEAREQAAREQAAREQAAREQAAREQAAREQQKAREASARQQQQQQQEQQRISNARGNAAQQQGAQSSEALFAQFKEEAAKHRDRTARIAALRRIANARQNEQRVAELDRLLARENERHGEWIRRTRTALGPEEFESQQARIDGRATRTVAPANTTRTSGAKEAGETPQRP